MKHDFLKPLRSRKELAEWAIEHGLYDGLGNSYWHEPDEKGVGAEVFPGIRGLDNAMGESLGDEHCVILTVEDKEGAPQPDAVVNLANLLQWACES